MKYRILEVLPALIKVEFEDGSWANVPIGPNQSPEEIDDAVSKYDPDFLPNPQDLINKNITVGEVRNSLPISETDPVDSQFTSETPEVKSPTLSFGSSNPIDAIAIGNYFSERGDDRIKEAITKNIEEFIELTNFSVEKMIDDLKYDSNEILMQALTELEAEGKTYGNE